MPTQVHTFDPPATTVSRQLVVRQSSVPSPSNNCQDSLEIDNCDADARSYTGHDRHNGHKLNREGGAGNKVSPRPQPHASKIGGRRGVKSLTSKDSQTSELAPFPMSNNGILRLDYHSMKDSWALRDGKPAGSGGAFYRSRGANKVARRLVHKNGDCNVSHVNVPKQRMKYIRDIFTTLIDVKWRWSLIIFSASFLFSWLLFAIIYFMICFARGDFNAVYRKSPGFEPCIINIMPYSFTSAFLFSLESQHTIGYGHRYISETCPLAIMVLCLQSVVGVIIQSFFAGIVFAKLARPKQRAKTLIFSKNAVIYMRDGKMCLLFRVGDMRKSHLVEAHVRLQMIKKKVTMEGEMLAFHQFDMNVGYDEGLDRIFLVWPLTICHEIDEASPLYEYSADDLLSARFEIVAILEGIVESTGMTTQARTSWLPSEILWGHRFEKLVTYQRENGDYKIDYARFHNSYPVDTPRCSAMQLDEMKEQGLMMPSVTVDADSHSGATTGEVGEEEEDEDDDEDGPTASIAGTQETGPDDSTSSPQSARRRLNSKKLKLSKQDEVSDKDSPTDTNFNNTIAIYNSANINGISDYRQQHAQSELIRRSPTSRPEERFEAINEEDLTSRTSSKVSRISRTSIQELATNKPKIIDSHPQLAGTKMNDMDTHNNTETRLSRSNSNANDHNNGHTSNIPSNNHSINNNSNGSTNNHNGASGNFGSIFRSSNAVLPLEPRAIDRESATIEPNVPVVFRKVPSSLTRMNTNPIDVNPRHRRSKLSKHTSLESQITPLTSPTGSILGPMVRKFSGANFPMVSVNPTKQEGPDPPGQTPLSSNIHMSTHSKAPGITAPDQETSFRHQHSSLEPSVTYAEPNHSSETYVSPLSVATTDLSGFNSATDEVHGLNHSANPDRNRFIASNHAAVQGNPSNTSTNLSSDPGSTTNYSSPNYSDLSSIGSVTNAPFVPFVQSVTGSRPSSVLVDSVELKPQAPMTQTDRLQHGWPQTELAGNSDVGTSTVLRIHNEIHKPE